MIKINLEFLSWLSQTLGIEESSGSLRFDLEVEGASSVRELLAQMAGRYPGFAQAVFDTRLQKLDDKVCIFFNGRQLELENGLETRLQEGDSLVFLPLIQGG